MSDAKTILKNIQKPPREPRPGDFRNDDGWLCCGVCGEPVEFVDDDGNRMRARCKCDPEQKAKEEREKRNAQEVAAKYLGRSKHFQDDSGIQSKLKDVRQYVDRWEECKGKGVGLLLWGDTGTGKTFAAVRAAKAIAEYEQRDGCLRQCYQIKTAGGIVTDLSNPKTDKTAYIRDICSAMVFVLDDFGAERCTDYGQEVMFNVIDEYYNTGKPLIVTTNLTLDELKECNDTRRKRLYSRITERCLPMKFEGEDIRKQ